VSSSPLSTPVDASSSPVFATILSVRARTPDPWVGSPVWVRIRLPHEFFHCFLACSVQGADRRRGCRSSSTPSHTPAGAPIGIGVSAAELQPLHPARRAVGPGVDCGSSGKDCRRSGESATDDTAPKSPDGDCWWKTRRRTTRAHSPLMGAPQPGHQPLETAVHRQRACRRDHPARFDGSDPSISTITRPWRRPRPPADAHHQRCTSRSHLEGGVTAGR
jgi:hypothetical protein